MTDEPGKSKLIIDEDWKSQVEAEKAAASAAKAQAETAKPKAAEPGGPDRGELPPPTLSSLVVTLATQAMAAMGVLADAGGNPLPADRDQAKYLIDTIAMLQEKTANNRTDDEARLFEDVLHQLRMTFVSVGMGP